MRLDFNMQFKEIWEANSLALKNFIATKVPEQEVSDILQNVSIELFKSIQGATQIKNHRNWLYQVTRNTIADHYKHKSKSTNSELSFLSNSQDAFQPCVCDIMEQIIKSVLPPQYSVPLILSDIHKVPQKEIAEQLEINYESAKSRIQRARKKIKEAFEQSVDLQYNKSGQIVGGMLKEKNNLPDELVEEIKKLQLEG